MTGDVVTWLRHNSYLVNWVLLAVQQIAQNDSQGASPQPVVEDSTLARSLYGEAKYSQCRERKLDEFAQAYARQRTNAGKARLFNNTWDMYRLAKTTVMVLADLRDSLADTRLHVMIIPERFQVKDSEWEWLQQRFPEKYIYRTLILDTMVEELERRGIAHTNLLPHLDETCYFLFDGHFNENGHRVVADVVTELMLTQYSSSSGE